ncbi:MAG TPA: hypothetical protein VFC79_06895 [Tissierellaceae bacterium]|nr:hypothetical protein [Tissierellaceae bacterium]
MEVCKEKHKRLDEKIETIEGRINTHGKEIDIIKMDIIAQKKDTTHLQDAIKDLKRSIDALIKEIGSLKTKPLEKYEKIAMVIISAVVGYLVKYWF